MERKDAPETGSQETEPTADSATETTETTAESTPEPAESTDALRPGRWRRRIRLALVALLAASAIGLGWWEARSSTLQALLFSEIARDADWKVADGPSPSVRFPEHGPYDRRLGYIELPAILERLSDRGWRIDRQARLSPKYLKLMDRGVFPPYREKQRAGLEVVDSYQNQLHASLYPTRVYSEFEDIPKLVVDTLLFVENRDLLDETTPKRNPAVEADRFIRALGEVAWAEIADGERPSGGSTLATQIEKFRHSPDGRTRGYRDKFKQMISASVRAYLSGENTLEEQRHVVLTYLNGVPLAAVRGFGEVFGLGDALYAWFDADFERVNALLESVSANGTRASRAEFDEAAAAYRKVLTLIVAQRRPSDLLRGGRRSLIGMVDDYLHRLEEAGVISEAFRDAALGTRPVLQHVASEANERPFRVRKLPYSLRTDLLNVTGASSLYELDRMDVKVEATVDYDVQRAVERTLAKLDEAEFLKEHRLDRWRLLAEGDPSEVIYSFTLYERGPDGNVLRLQADTFEGPFNVNEGVKLNLGSTAKLRTAVSYLQVVADLWEEYAGLPPEQLDPSEFDWRDRISRWVVRHLEQNRYATLEDTLQAALMRRYSAKPKTFFTGGGLHHFSNFSYKYNLTWPTIRKGLQKSINLVFIHLMRDLVRYHMFRMEDSGPDILRDPNHPKRRGYLERFAAHEGDVFLKRFWDKYEGFDTRQRLIRLLGKRNWSAEPLATIHRSIYPEADIYTFNHFLTEHLGRELGWSFVKEMYRKLHPDEMGLNDRGYLASVHPLELWLLRYLRAHPEADWSQITEASAEAKQKSYQWLFRTGRKSGQDRRIRIMLEKDAFAEIHRQWKALGYPFDKLVPSYATALGSSADRPSALAELIGIIVNDGQRKPTVQFRSMHFAANTPFETKLTRRPPRPEQVMRPEVAKVARDAMVSVVQEGTAERLTKYRQFADLDEGREKLAADTKAGEYRWIVGGKTGTGDNRFEVHNSRGRLVRSIPRNRTATFTFFLDDRFFGALTAYVPGKQSGQYNFTSSLAVSILGILAPKLEPLWERGGPGGPDGAEDNAPTLEGESLVNW